MMQAVKPAIAEQTMWQYILSSIRFLLTIISFAWSKVAISAAFIIELRIMFGPSPVHSPPSLLLKQKVPLCFDYLHVGVRDSFVSSLVLRLLSFTLESDFYHVSWICHHNSEAPCG